MYDKLMAFAHEHQYVLIGAFILAGYVFLVNHLRFRRLNAIKQKCGFSTDSTSYENMTPDIAQEIEKNLAEYEMPWLFEFSWLFDFLRVST